MKSTHSPIYVLESHAREALSRKCFRLRAKPQLAQLVAFRDLFVQVTADDLPAHTAIVEIEHTNKLLQVIVDEGVIQSCIHAFKCICDNGMPWCDDVIKCLEVCGGNESRWVDAQTAEVTDDEAFELPRLYIETCQGILWMRLKCDTVDDDRW